MLKFTKITSLFFSVILGASCVFAAENDGVIAQEAIKRKLEATIVNEEYLAAHQDRGISPDSGSKIVRRTLADYEAENPNSHKIVLFSGHEGPHSGIYGTTQDSSHYMIDECWFEVKPDLVLNINEHDNLYYFPDNWADLIAVDDSRFLRDEDISPFIRILKPTGKLVFKPGFGMGWVTLSMSFGKELDDSTNILDSVEIAENGRVAYAPQTAWSHFMKEEGKVDFQRFKDKAIENARSFYKPMGVTFSFDTENYCFVLTKN